MSVVDVNSPVVRTHYFCEKSRAPGKLLTKPWGDDENLLVLGDRYMDC
jgi:hypothetical protein